MGEKSATYVNTEGRVQETKSAVDMPQQARDDWKIIRALSEFLGHALPYNSLADVQARLAEVSPTFAVKEEVSQASFTESSAGSEGSGAISKFEPSQTSTS